MDLALLPFDYFSKVLWMHKNFICLSVDLVNILAHLNSGFINFLLEHIEATDQDVESERIVDGFIRLILSFNLHFELPEENIVMKVFAERGTAKTFTEKLLLMLNREGETVLLSFGILDNYFYESKCVIIGLFYSIP